MIMKKIHGKIGAFDPIIGLGHVIDGKGQRYPFHINSINSSFVSFNYLVLEDCVTFEIINPREDVLEAINITKLIKTKICSVCKIEKTLDYFYKSKGGIYGLRSNCKKCHSLWDKKHYKIHCKRIKKNKYKWVKLNLEKVKNQNSRHYKKHKISCLKQSKKWRINNLKKSNEISKGYRQKNPEVDYFNNFGLSIKNIPTKMRELKKQQLLLKRAVKHNDYHNVKKGDCYV